jgi:hypothetical protein
VHRLRSRLLAVVTEEDIAEVIHSLLKQAKGGNVLAARELFDRVFGRAPQGVDLRVHQTPSLSSMTDSELIALAQLERERMAGDASGWSLIDELRKNNELPEESVVRNMTDEELEAAYAQGAAVERLACVVSGGSLPPTPTPLGAMTDADLAALIADEERTMEPCSGDDAEQPDPITAKEPRP